MDSILSTADGTLAAPSRLSVPLSLPLSLSRSGYRYVPPCADLCRSGDLNLDPQTFMAVTLQPCFCG